jgi:DNA processing protein
MGRRTYEAAGEAEREAALAFLSIRGVGPATLGRLVERFGSLAGAREIFGPEWLKLLRAEAREDFLAAPDLSRRLDELHERCTAHGARILLRGERGWPTVFNDLGDVEPEVLFLRGTLKPELTAIGIVGSRETDTYGIDFARSLAHDLARQGKVVLSGGAEGIDTAAHRGALDAHGTTWAVLGSGFDHPYPPENVGLFAKIANEGGALLSEFPPQHEVKPGNFPRRNKLVAALCRALVVVRGSPTSGAMLTAEDARQLRRPLLAVPGSVGVTQSMAANRLLQAGFATACTESDDVLRAIGEKPAYTDAEVFARPTPAQRELFAMKRATSNPNQGSAPAPSSASVQLNAELSPVYEALAAGPLLFDELATRARLPAPSLASALTQLELLGLVEQQPGKRFTRR